MTAYELSPWPDLKLLCSKWMDVTPLRTHSGLMNSFNKVIFLRFYNELKLHILFRGGKILGLSSSIKISMLSKSGHSTLVLWTIDIVGTFRDEPRFACQFNMVKYSCHGWGLHSVGAFQLQLLPLCAEKQQKSVAGKRRTTCDASRIVSRCWRIRTRRWSANSSRWRSCIARRSRQLRASDLLHLCRFSLPTVDL